MRGQASIGLFMGVIGASGCNYEVTQFRLQLDVFPPEEALLGEVVDAVDLVFSDSGEGSDSIDTLVWSSGTPGQHYSVWVEDAHGDVFLADRWVIVLPPPEVLEYAFVTVENSPQVRDYDTKEFSGWVNTTCFSGPCGGVEFSVSELFDGPRAVTITREQDGSPENEPSDDVFVRGSVQPYARGTIRGTLTDPFGNATPVAEVTLLPQVDNTQF